MFTPRSKIKLEKFDLEKESDLRELEKLLSRPDIIIRSRRQVTLSDQEKEGDSVATYTRLIEHVEYEECSL
jgi:hypothetical protein